MKTSGLCVRPSIKKYTRLKAIIKLMIYLKNFQIIHLNLKVMLQISNYETIIKSSIDSMVEDLEKLQKESLFDDKSTPTQIAKYVNDIEHIIEVAKSFKANVLKDTTSFWYAEND